MTFSTLRYALNSQGIATVTFDEPGSPVNTMKPKWQADMLALADQLTQDQAQLQGVLLTSAKYTFFAGADLKGVLKLQASDVVAAFTGIEALKKAFRRIETLGKPVVALLEGAALGGGWELALVAHARFALDNPKISLGLPEVSLGLIPGATGITKMTRLLGLMAAQPYLMEGKLFNPSEALSLGLVDGLASTPEQLVAMALAFIKAHPQIQQPWDRKGYRMPGGSVDSPALAAALALAPAMLFNKTHGLYPAPQAVLEAMVEGAQVDYDTATRIESRKLAKLMVGQTTKNMVNAFFFNLNAIKAGKSRPIVNDSPGSFTHRVFGTFVMEGVAMYAEGIPTHVIEHAAAAAGMSAGPLTGMDETALPLAVDELKRVGRFFEKALLTDPQALQQALKQRLLYRQAVETARCMQENVITSSHEANIASLGFGFPAWTGGALQFVFSEGLDIFVSNCHALAQHHGEGFALSKEVIDCLTQHAA